MIIQKKRFEIIFKIGQVIAIFPSETKKFQKFKRELLEHFPPKLHGGQLGL